jgi:hypothetical protein
MLRVPISVRSDDENLGLLLFCVGMRDAMMCWTAS